MQNESHSFFKRNAKFVPEKKKIEKWIFSTTYSYFFPCGYFTLGGLDPRSDRI